MEYDRKCGAIKKAVNETPVEEPNLANQATPFGVGISLTTLGTGFHTYAVLAVYQSL